MVAWNLSPQVAERKKKKVFVDPIKRHFNSDSCDLTPAKSAAIMSSLSLPLLFLPLVFERQAGVIAQVLEKHNHFKINAQG